MAIYSDVNLTGGVDNALISLAQQIPALPIGLLLFVFIIVLLGGSASQSKRFGYSDMPMWALFASLSCLLLSLIMTMKEGIIGLDILGIVVAITILSGFWYFTSRGKGEM